MYFSEAVVNKTVVGKTFKKEMKLICDELSKLSVNEVLDVENKLNKNGSVSETCSVRDTGIESSACINFLENTYYARMTRNSS